MALARHGCGGDTWPRTERKGGREGGKEKRSAVRYLAADGEKGGREGGREKRSAVLYLAADGAEEHLREDREDAGIGGEALQIRVGRQVS
jgi:hypothetical protein